uniref:Uncharacterized protein n=1 Tax=Plectus sambesii TaxID=2011161 RepID=A0A914X429_9BILA
MQHSRGSQSDGALFMRIDNNIEQSSSAELTARSAPSSSREPKRSIISGEVAVNIDEQQTMTSPVNHSADQSPSAPTSVADTQVTMSTTANPPRELVRQVTFGVQTELSPENLADFVFQSDDGGYSARSRHTSSSVGGRRCCSALRSSLDSVFLCYGITGSVLIAFGGAVIYMIAVDDRSLRDRTTVESTSQLWIIGPIFICAGVLVCIKAFTHVYNRLHPERFGMSPRRGAFLTADSRSSLNCPPNLPPTYSFALNAPIPSGVIEEEDKLSTRSNETDDASLGRVTINFDPPPPTYDEATRYFFA